MTAITWDSGEIDHAGRAAQGDGAAIAQRTVEVTDPDPGMYGSFLAGAVGLTEPRASDHHRELIAALGAAITGLGDRAVEAAALYDATGRAAEQAVDEVFAALGDPDA